MPCLINHFCIFGSQDDTKSVTNSKRFKVHDSVLAELSTCEMTTRINKMSESLLWFSCIRVLPKKCSRLLGLCRFSSYLFLVQCFINVSPQDFNHGWLKRVRITDKKKRKQRRHSADLTIITGYWLKHHLEYSTLKCFFNIRKMQFVLHVVHHSHKKSGFCLCWRGCCN